MKKSAKEMLHDICLKIRSLCTAVEDSGWITATLSSQFTAYSTDSAPRYRKIGNMVEIRGAVKTTSAITGSGTRYTIFTLPQEYRPSDYNVVTVCQGSSFKNWCFEINTDGTVQFSRHNTGSAYADLGTTQWLPFHATYFIGGVLLNRITPLIRKAVQA